MHITGIKKTSRSMKKIIGIAILVSAFFVILILLNKGGAQSDGQVQVSGAAPENNVSVQDGKQVIVLRAKAGYFPRHTVAKAGVPTVLKFSTNGTFDCSSSVRIPSLGLSRNLPPTGEVEIDLGQQKAGLFSGTCAMGMYSFDIDFKS